MAKGENTFRFTDRGLKSLKAPKSGRVEYWDSIITGLGLRVSQAGRKSWVVMYRAGGRLRRMTLGTYPTLPLSDAREEAGEILRAATKGEDPATEKSAARKADTFNELADLYLEKYAKGDAYVKWEGGGEKGEPPAPNKRSWAKDEAIIKRNLRSVWGTRKANAITRRDVNCLLNEIIERGAPVQANRVLEVVRKMYSWAIGSDRINMEVNPCHEVKKPTKEKGRDRVLDAGEIETVWPMAGEGAKINDLSRIALRLILATAQRPGEVTGLIWRELDDDWESSVEPFWTQPGDRTKNGRVHRVPLSSFAVSLLKEAKGHSEKSEWAFPSPRGSGPMWESSLSHALVRSAHFGVAHFTPHDLRRSASSHMTGPHCRVSRFILERVLNHSEKTVTGRTYDLYEYDAEKREALNVWASRLHEITLASSYNPVKSEPE